MNLLIFDTETTSLDKPFCYNVGYTIVNLESKEPLIKRDFVIEQVWHNLPLFETAYYADKRPLYVNRMKAQKVKMSKWGHIMRTMRADIKQFEIEFGFAYNSNFDEKVFAFNCDWFKVSNPLDTITVLDIRTFAIDKICKTDEYKNFCEQYELFTDSGNYSTTAEALFRFISNDCDFIEEHTALSDSIIESEILLQCYELGSNITEKITCPRSIERKVLTTLQIKKGKELIFESDCNGYTVSRKYNTIYLK